MIRFAEGREKIRDAEGIDTLSIVLAGDTCPHDTAINVIKEGNSSEILKDVKPYLDDADLSIVQWETTLTDADTPLDKNICGPNLKCPPQCVDFAKAAGFDVALLANNHIGDFGPAVALETKEILESNGIKTVGVGENLKSSSVPLLFKSGNFNIGIINVAEHEFGTAGKDKPGCAPLEPLDNIKLITELAQKVDITLVVVHGGNEHYPVPSPRMIKTYRAFADAGASAVVNIHTHCPQGIEVWHGVPIVYSPGNFFFPSSLRTFDSKDFWWTGYLPKFSFDHSGAFAIEVLPFTFNQDPCEIKPFKAEKKERFFKYLSDISAIISDTDAVEQYFDAWCALKGPENLAGMKKFSSPWPISLDIQEEVSSILPLRNHFTCEAHNELKTNFLRMVEEYRTAEAKKLIPRLEKLRQADFA